MRDDLEQQEQLDAIKGFWGDNKKWIIPLAALLLIPLAQVVAIEFTMPIWSAALAVALLGERMDRGKWIAVALGLAGVVAIVRPSASP